MKICQELQFIEVFRMIRGISSNEVEDQITGKNVVKPTGGPFAQTIRLLTFTLKRFNLAYRNFVTFSFYLLSTFWQNVRKIRGGCCICFLNETSRKIEHMNFCFALKPMKCIAGYSLRPKKRYFQG